MVDPSVPSTKDKVQLSGLSVLHVGPIGVLIDEVLMPKVEYTEKGLMSNVEAIKELTGLQ